MVAVQAKIRISDFLLTMVALVRKTLSCCRCPLTNHLDFPCRRCIVESGYRKTFLLISRIYLLAPMTISKEKQDRLSVILAKIKDHDFRLTPQRLAIIRILATSETHPSVDEVYQEVRVDFPTTSLATVYKTISLLKELGEILELGFPDGSNRYDGRKPYPHPHAICVKCKKIMDPEISSAEELAAEMKEKTGYSLLSHRFDFFGLCLQCQ